MAKEPEKLSAAQRSKIRRLTAPRELDADEEGGELNIVPFLDIIMNVLMFVLATVAVTFTATIDSSAPKPAGSGARASTDDTLGLAVLVVPDGFSLKASGGNVAPGCNDKGPGLAVPAKGHLPDGSVDYDFAKLTDCAKKLKGLSPAYADETQVIVSANPNIPYQAIISTIDALRKDPSIQANPDKPHANDLFPDINFGLAR